VAAPLRLAPPPARVALEDAARLVHDLRGPLTVIRGQCFCLGRGERRPEFRRRLGLIEEEVDRLTRALNGLLGLAAPYAADPSDNPVALAGLVAEVADRHGGAAAQAGVRLSAGARARGLCVAGDPDLLRRALDNLVENALRHAPRGGQVRVTLSRRGREAVVRVRDDGSGVDAAERETIFAAGVRGRDARGPGRGLGLAIARQVAEAHGGALELEPLGPGATFRLTLPLWDAEHAGGDAA
jgi:signal transduction histidine kinase